MAASGNRTEAIPKKWTAPLCHEDVFIERYQRLRGWALRLAGNLTDADDLLHDAFLQFVLRRRDLSEIESVDAYLYGMLRRLRLSKRRAALRAREDPLDAIDYDTAELSLRASDPRDAMRLREELYRVCAYACRRKSTSKSGSVLLLRFFHGFFPGEIARILKCPLRGANDWLRLARREARESLAAPARPGADSVGPPVNGRGRSGDASDPLDELREMIWAAREGECVSASSLARIYGGAGTLSCVLLAHVVSCPECLARVTALLGMRGPIDRDPHDMLRQDTSWRFAQGRSPEEGGSGLASQFRRWENALRTVQEHVPREIRVAANGLPLGACSVNASECTFTLAVNIDEPLDFIEIFSEQGVRLALWEVEPPPTGDADQEGRVELNGGRSLSMAAHFNGHRPSLDITYRDPAWIADSDPVPASAAPVVSFRALDETVPSASIWQRVRARLAIPTFGRASRLTPQLTLRLAMAVLLTASALGIWIRAPWRLQPVSAAQILADARSLEIKTAAAPNLAVHRVLRLEERRLPDGVVLRRSRIEGWQSGNRRLTARRLYDEGGRLVAAEWVHPDGTRTVYARGQAPRVQHAGDSLQMTTASVWQWEPSAIAFERLVGGAEAAVIREQDDRYLIEYRAALAPDADGLVEATLVVAKNPLRPIAQTLVVREHGASTAFHFSESTRAEVPDASVPDATFEPEPELAPPSPAFERAPATSPGSTTTPTPIDPRVIDRLEVDLLFLLHRLEGCLEAPAEMAAGSSGVGVTAVAASEACRDKIRQAVQASARDGAPASVTFAPRAASTSVQRIDARGDLEALPAYRDIIGRFAAAGLGAPADSTVRGDAAVIAARAFGTWALEHSQRARDEVLHLDRLTARWSVGALEALDVDRVTRWQDVVRDHARRFRRETEALRVQLYSFLPSAGGVSGDADSDRLLSVRSVLDVRPAVERLGALAGAQHEAVRQLLDPGLKAPRTAVDYRTLIATLKEAEAQAAWFDEPWTLPKSTAAFGIAASPRHISMNAR